MFNDDQRFGDLVCSELIKRATTGLPGVAEYRLVGYNGMEFPDCFETVIRMLCNFIAYNQEQQLFQPPDTASKEIKDFYAAGLFNNKVDKIAHPDVHKAWAQVVSNQEGILYRNIKIAGHGGDGIRTPDGYSGFVRGILPPDMDKKVPLSVGGNEVNAYEAVLPNDLKILIINDQDNRYELYNMRASVRNIIIQLNRLYNLDLYLNLDKVYFNADFNQTYFSALCAQFPQWTPVSGADNLDNSDLKNDIDIQVEALGEQFTIHLSRYHGYVSVAHEAAAREDWKSEIVSQAIEILTEAGGDPHKKMKAWYLIGLYGEREDIWSLYDNANGKMYARNALYGGKYLAEEATRFEIVRDIIDHERLELYPLINRLIPTFSIQRNLSYPTQILRAYGSKIEQLESLQGGIGAMMSQVAKSGFLTYDYLVALGNLVEKGQAFGEATVAAGRGMESDNSRIQTAAFLLLEKLIEKGHGIKLAKEAMASSNPGVREQAFSLFVKFIKKGQVFGEAIQVAKNGMASEDTNIQLNAGRLLRILIVELTLLVERDQAFDKAILAARAGIASQDTAAQSSGINLLRILINKLMSLLDRGDQVFDEATLAVQATINTSINTSIASFGKVLLRQLFGKLKEQVEKDQAFGEATRAAQAWVTSQDHDGQQMALELFEKLVKKDQAFDEATRAARWGMANENSGVRQKALELSNSLERHGIRRSSQERQP